MADQDSETPENERAENEQHHTEKSPDERPQESHHETPSVSSDWDRPARNPEPGSDSTESIRLGDSSDSEHFEPSQHSEPVEDRQPEQPSSIPGEPPQQQDQRRDQRQQGRNRFDRGQRTNYRNRPDNRNRGDRPERGERSEQRESRPDEKRGEPERSDRPERQERSERQHQGRSREPYQDRRGGGRSPERGSERSSLHGSDISVVIPLYNEEQSLRELCEQLKNVLQRSGQYELIFVDDGSTDGSFRVLQELRNREKRIKIIRFRRNFGKSAALSVGFHHAKGEIIITMDADLQDDPGEIPNLVNEIKKGFDLVSGWKKRRHDPISKTIPSKFFNFVTSVLTGVRLHDMNCGLKAYRKEVVKDLKIYGELHRYIPALAKWQGFKIGEAVVQHRPRKYGKTKFGVGRFWKGFLDLLTVLFTTRYLQRPLHLFGFWGVLFFAAGFSIDSYLAYLKLFEGLSLSNRPLFLGGILLIIVGIQFISVGLIGELITKTRQSGQEEYSVKEVWK